MVGGRDGGRKRDHGGIILPDHAIFIPNSATSHARPTQRQPENTGGGETWKSRGGRGQHQLSNR